MTALAARRAHSRGFSLIELLMSIAITTVITGAIVALMYSQIQLSATQNRNMLNQANVRDVVKFLVEEMQLAGTADGSEPLITADSNAFSFYADIDADGVFDEIDYYLDEDNTLMRRYTTDSGGTPFVAEDPLLNNVYYLGFVYYAQDDAVPTDLSEITSVEVRLQLDTSAHATSFTGGRLAPQAMIGRATLRNKTLGSSGP
jgi:prepilin-type N-terminal cleavage/methylation domain-containing protein